RPAYLYGCLPGLRLIHTIRATSIEPCSSLCPLNGLGEPTLSPIAIFARILEIPLDGIRVIQKVVEGVSASKSWRTVFKFGCADPLFQHLLNGENGREKSE